MDRWCASYRNCAAPDAGAPVSNSTFPICRAGAVRQLGRP